MSQEPKAATTVNSFAENFDTIYDQKRNPFTRWVDGKFRSDMFIRYALTFEALEYLRGGTVLDVGCGSGPYFAEAFKRGVDRVTGIDPAPNMLTLVRHRLAQAGVAADRYRLIERMFPGVSVEPHDFAIVMGVMDYVEDAQASLKALRPVVKQPAVVSFSSEHCLVGNSTIKCDNVLSTSIMTLAFANSVKQRVSQMSVSGKSREPVWIFMSL